MNNIKPLYGVRSKNVSEKKSLICFHEFKYFQGPPTISQKALFLVVVENQRSSLPTPLLFPSCCDRENRGRERAEYSADCSFSRNSECVYWICSTQVSVHTEHALLPTPVNGWESHVVGVERVCPARLKKDMMVLS